MYEMYGCSQPRNDKALKRRCHDWRYLRFQSTNIAMAEEGVHHHVRSTEATLMSTGDIQLDPILKSSEGPAATTSPSGHHSMEKKCTPVPSMKQEIINTENKPEMKATVVIPDYLIEKMMRSNDLVPSPWKTINQLIVVSYISILFCVLTGLFANHYALAAKKYEELGLLSEAKVLSRHAAKCIYVSFAIGPVMAVTASLAVIFST